jgi:NTE family protein
MTPSREERVAAAAAARERHSSPQPTGRLKSTDVKYLSFEGGGSKGITYLGAIEALEGLKVLPIDKPPGKNQILGIAGSSAGAITALALALGFTSADIRGLLADAETFNGFYDGPDPGVYRVIDQSNKVQVGRDQGVTPDVVTARTDALGSVIPNLIGRFLADDPMSVAIKRDVGGYLYNLLYDRGLFPGFSVAKFFMDMTRSFTEKAGARRRSQARVPGDGSGLTFEQLRVLTGIDLVIMGVNVTTKRVGSWSASTTPSFPVALAAMISMNIPLLFKPVRIDELAIGSGPRYGGFWVDGGVLNNFPLHAFDEKADNPKRSSTPGLSGLHPNVLGIRLTPGFPPTVNLSGDLPDPLQQSIFSVLGAYVSDLVEVLTSPAEEGQVRTPAERNQIIELFTGELALTEFTPPPSKYEWPVKNAKEVVAAYFSKPTK